MLQEAISNGSFSKFANWFCSVWNVDGIHSCFPICDPAYLLVQILSPCLALSYQTIGFRDRREAENCVPSLLILAPQIYCPAYKGSTGRLALRQQNPTLRALRASMHFPNGNTEAQKECDLLRKTLWQGFLPWCLQMPTTPWVDFKESMNFNRKHQRKIFHYLQLNVFIFFFQFTAGNAPPWCLPSCEFVSEGKLDRLPSNHRCSCSVENKVLNYHTLTALNLAIQPILPKNVHYPTTLDLSTLQLQSSPSSLLQANEDKNEEREEGSGNKKEKIRSF